MVLGRDLLEDLMRELVVALVRDLVEDYSSRSYLRRPELAGRQVKVACVDRQSPADVQEVQVVEQSLLKD